MSSSLRLTKFKDVDLSDPFFDSLKDQYAEFPDWFVKKAESPVYAIEDAQDGRLTGFLYVKVETGAVEDVTPPLPPLRRLKVGTLKIDAHGTKLGERALKKIFDHAISEAVDEIYVTVFDTHTGLINLFKRYGFVHHGTKTTVNGAESVLKRNLRHFFYNAVKDYPFIHTDGVDYYLLAVYPEYHTNLFPDSILKNEDQNLVEDVSHTNTIHKVYLAKLALTRFKSGDVVVIYRTTDRKGQARFRSVTTSLCVVEETRRRQDFANVEDFLAWALPHSVFDEEHLRNWYGGTERLFAVKMLYNAAFKRRTIRDKLLDEVGISEQPRWDLRKLTKHQFDHIVRLGELNERLIID